MGLNNHGVVFGQVPLGAIVFRAHVVLGAQVTLQRLELATVFQTDQEIGADRLANRHGRFFRFWRNLDRASRHRRQGRVDIGDQAGQIVGRYAVIADVCGHNVCRHFKKF